MATTQPTKNLASFFVPGYLRIEKLTLGKAGLRIEVAENPAQPFVECASLALVVKDTKDLVSKHNVKTIHGPLLDPTRSADSARVLPDSGASA